MLPFLQAIQHQLLQPGSYQAASLASLPPAPIAMQPAPIASHQPPPNKRRANQDMLEMQETLSAIPAPRALALSDLDLAQFNHLEEQKALFQSHSMRRNHLRPSTLSYYDKYRKHYLVSVLSSFLFCARLLC